MNKGGDYARELKTGEYITINNVLSEKHTNKLKEITGRLKSSDSRPIYIAKEDSLGGNVAERYHSAGLDVILRKSTPWIKAMIGPRWLVLANKALLRRTWPMSEKEARGLGHNASNLTLVLLG